MATIKIQYVTTKTRICEIHFDVTEHKRAIFQHTAVLCNVIPCVQINKSQQSYRQYNDNR